MRLLVDAQLPPALARWLVEQGHAAEHVHDLGLHAADDRVLWDYAVPVGAVIVTKDEDFALRRTLGVGWTSDRVAAPRQHAPRGVVGLVLSRCCRPSSTC
jgi:hypothetical protein